MDQAEASNDGTPGVEAVSTPNGDVGLVDSPPNPDISGSPSTRDMLTLFNPPPNLEMLRQRLYEVKEKIELTVDEWNLYWPYVDNVWCRTQRRADIFNGLYETDYYACRLHRATYQPDPARATDESKPKRKKQRREGGTCQMRLKAVLFRGACPSYTITQVGEFKEHTHDLDHMDKVKRNSVVMDIAKSEVMKGYMSSS
ncbi:MAG: 2,5-diamino-6-(ribosylamino)-4(3H)-pyrimidinone 5'-phosphate reductase, partial [Pleopsidium flavum]